MSKSNLTGYPSIDKPWLKYYSENAFNAQLPECTIYQNIYNHNKDYPNDVALLYFGKKITYRQLFCEVEKAEKAFIAQGVKRGDNVALCVPATPEATPEQVRASFDNVKITPQNAAIFAPILARREEDKKSDLVSYMQKNWNR